MATTNTLYFIITVLSTFLTITNSTPLSPPSILLSFKSTIDDPSQSLASWSNATATHHCNWTGITCQTIPYENTTEIISINLQSLNLSGQLNPELCQLQYLSSLNLANNLFNQPIPLHFSQCRSLRTLNMSNNLLWGPISDQISLLKSLDTLDLSMNHLEGNIPESIGLLTELRVLNLGGNLLSGDLRRYFGNFTKLVVLNLSENPFLESELPSEIGKLQKLEQLLLSSSGLFGNLPRSITTLTNLKVVDLSRNNLTGQLPKNLGVGIKLESFDVSGNKLSGPFPSKICGGRNVLNTLSLHTNYFSGSLPVSVSKCVSLERFQVQNNGFFGNFPDGVWSLPKIRLIRAENNKFSGKIHENISNAMCLEQVQIDNNSFSGVIPHGLGLVKSLYRFSASNNDLVERLPPNFCDSPVMSIINLSHNSLSGEIPEAKRCRKLVSLSLASNSFVGEIPHSLGGLPVLTYLDLSDNSLSGSIPSELENLKLAMFNVSFNKLSGSVPPSLVSGLPASYLQGNPDLCGSGLPKSCMDDGISDQGIGLIKLAFAFISIGLVIATLLAAFGFVIVRLYRQKSEADVIRSVFFYPLRISEQDLVMAINEKTAMGNGGTFGRVHIISLPSGELIAVKKLVNSGTQSTKVLKSEIKTLAKIRHKNIVKILGFCCTDDSIFLIYEHLSKGSLGDIIGKSDFQMEWNVRLRIAIGVAQALAYLHNDYSPHLLHRNVKANNILLDSDFQPKLTDFALDRIVGDAAFQSILAFRCPPSCYVAPESKYEHKPTEEMDVYSFGVLLLELVTGKRAEPTDSEEGSLDIVKWVRRKINIANGDQSILDPRILNSSQDEMLGALEISLHCTSIMPEKRPSMAQIVRTLQSLGSKSSSRHLQLMSSSGIDVVSPPV